MENLQEETYAKMAACAGVGVCNIPIAIERKRMEEKEAAVAEELKKQQLHESLAETMLELMWHVTVIDIEYTLRKVCFKVIHDHSVSSDIRKSRMQALLVIGEIFKANGSEYKDIIELMKPLCLRHGKGKNYCNSSVEEEPDDDENTNYEQFVRNYNKPVIF